MFFLHIQISCDFIRCFIFQLNFPYFEYFLFTESEFSYFKFEIDSHCVNTYTNIIRKWFSIKSILQFVDHAQWNTCLDQHERSQVFLSFFFFALISFTESVNFHFFFINLQAASIFSSCINSYNVSFGIVYLNY